MWSLVATRFLAATIVLLGSVGQPPMTIMPKFPILLDKNVPGELELAADQERSIKEKLAEFTQDAPGGGGGQPRIVIRLGGDGSDITNLEEEIDRILDAKQRQRLRELWLQRHGMMTLADDSVAKDLALTTAQRQKVSDILGEFHGTIVDEGPADPQDPEAMKKYAERIRELRSTAVKKLSEALTDKQRETFKKLQGKEFKFSVPGS